MTGRRSPEVCVLDLDGTLVDSVYEHTAAWQQAFREVGLMVPTYRIHRAVGMGGDRLVAAVAGDSAEQAIGDVVRKLHDEYFEQRTSQVPMLDGVAELLVSLDQARLRLVLASSSRPENTERLLELVEGSWRITEKVSGSEGPSKPAPDLVEQALERAGSRRAFMVGDAVWDVKSAGRAGIPCVGLLTGGFAEAELRDAGAVAVYDTPRALHDDLAEVLTAVAGALAG